VVDFHAVYRCTICDAQADSEAHIPGITTTACVDILTKAVTSNPQTDQPKFPNQICDSHQDLIEHTTNVYLIPPLIINTDTRKQTRSTEIQTNPFPLPSLTHPLLPWKHTPHLTSETPPLSVPQQVHPNRVRPHQTQPNFFFGGFSQHSSSRSPREGVDTCRDRVLNSSGQGYYGQAKTDRAVKATHGTQVPS